VSTVDVHLVGDGVCRIVHRESGAEIRSSKAPEYGGLGGAFSSTDLLAAALGSCIATNLEPVALRHAVPLEAFEISVEKRLAVEPKRIEALAVEVHLRQPVPPPVLTRLERAAHHCLVHRSLSPDVAVTIAFVHSR
jgi:putative redox protein